MQPSPPNAAPPIVPRRRIDSISAVLLPFTIDGAVDWGAYETLLARTVQARLAPAINMDTGYANLLSPAQRQEVLTFAAARLQGQRFIAGTYVEDGRGDALPRYLAEIQTIEAAGGVPILFQCTALRQMPEPEVVQLHRAAAAASSAGILAFELGEMFAPFGRIYGLDTIAELMQIPKLLGIKHSSLKRDLEWDRLALRNRVRPGFHIYTGNDLAIDMVMYGSDYLLGLSAFCPDAFAVRDCLWEIGDRRFYELNDLLQYLGCFAFRSPVPAYKHSAAQFLMCRGWLKQDAPPRGALTRPASELEILRDIAARLDHLLAEIHKTTTQEVQSETRP